MMVQISNSAIYIKKLFTAIIFHIYLFILKQVTQAQDQFPQIFVLKVSTSCNKTRSSTWRELDAIRYFLESMKKLFNNKHLQNQGVKIKKQNCNSWLSKIIDFDNWFIIPKLFDELTFFSFFFFFLSFFCIPRHLKSSVPGDCDFLV